MPKASKVELEMVAIPQKGVLTISSDSQKLVLKDEKDNEIQYYFAKFDDFNDLLNFEVEMHVAERSLLRIDVYSDIN